MILLIGKIYISKENQQIVKNIEKHYVDNEKLSETFLKKAKNKINKQSKKESNDYFILGYISLNYDKNEKLAKNYFEKTLSSLSEKTNSFAKVYSYYYLAKDAKNSKNIDKAIDYAKESFESLDKNQYVKYQNIIWETFECLIDTEKGRELALKSYNKMKNYEYLLNKESKLYFYKKLAKLNKISSKYVYSMEHSLSVIDLAERLGNDEELYRAIIEMALVAKQTGQYKLALGIMDFNKNIKIKNKRSEADLIFYKFINLAEIESLLENNEKAINYINKIENYEKYIDENKLDDLKAVKKTVEAEYYLEKENFKLANKYLKEAKYLIDNDKQNFYKNKEFIYYKSLAKLYTKEKKYNEAINIYINIINLAQKTLELEYIETSLDELINLYNITNNGEKEYENGMALLKLKDYKNNIFSKHYYENIIYKFCSKKLRKESINIKITNVIFKILILILATFIFTFNIYPKIRKCINRRKIRNYRKENNYIIHYQPIVNPKENEIVGFEALIRLKLNNELIMPSIIIDNIEKYDMMGEISIWILKKIIKDYEKLKKIDNLSEKFYVSMNISLKEVEDDNILGRFKEIIKNSNIKEKSICIEITENNSYKDQKKAKENIEKLRKYGFLVALDDFGVEYSNISILGQFKFDIIKLDKYFIDNIHETDISKTVIEVFDYLSCMKEKNIVIEGVEEQYQVDFIKDTSSNKFYVQGYLYSKPLELDDLKNFKLNIN
ncbi:EAL domain-containing protein [Paraclostridium tenue]|uniref:EAL domain-containing protein n=1 Tax=Paraclostridium tenue TaxID=1737 RepID=A0ABN1M0U7_9FIRM